MFSVITLHQRRITRQTVIHFTIVNRSIVSGCESVDEIVPGAAELMRLKQEV